ncbi:hypothetical protein CVS40_0599 [Lucilia cuprina]|nr:hypothetical protein CVS40_0599 [Lucilia cuprina]
MSLQTSGNILNNLKSSFPTKYHSMLNDRYQKNLKNSRLLFIPCRILVILDEQLLPLIPVFKMMSVVKADGYLL